MASKPMIPRQGTRGDASHRRPDAGARKAAKKVRDLKAMAKRFAPVVPDSRRIAAMSTRELIAALEELIRAETLYLSRSKDPRPIREDKPIQGGFRLVFKRWRPDLDPDAVEDVAKRLGTDLDTVLDALAEQPRTDPATVFRDLAKRLGKDPATVLQSMAASNRRRQ